MELAESSVGSYARRLEHFVEWCDDEGVDHLADLEPWDLGAYEDHRRAVVAPVSLNNELTTRRQLLDWAAGLDPPGDLLLRDSSLSCGFVSARVRTRRVAL